MRIINWIAALSLLAGKGGLAQTAQKINLKDISVTFTNVQGDVFTNVSLAHGDLDGITYFCDGGGGFISYTNLSADLLTQWGIPMNRIAIAAQRAATKSEQDRQFWASRAVQAQALQGQYAQQLAEQQAQAAAAAAAAAANNNNQTNTLAPAKKSGRKQRNGN